MVSDAAALLEVAAGAARVFPRGDAAALAEALAAALRPDERERLRAAARGRAGLLGWAEPLAAWQRLLARVAAPPRA